MFYNDFHDFTKKTTRSYGRYAHSGIRVRPKTKENDKFGKNSISKNNSPGLKATFPKQVTTTMNSTFHKCVVNVSPATNPTPMSKSGR